jgi:hypothetical protein
MSAAAAANGGGGAAASAGAGPQRIVEMKHQLYSHDEEEEQEDSPRLEENRHLQCHHHHIAADLLVPSSSSFPASPSSFTSVDNGAHDDIASSSDPDASSIDSHDDDGLIPFEEVAAAPGEWKQRVFTILVAGTGFLADSYDLL